MAITGECTAEAWMAAAAFGTRLRFSLPMGKLRSSLMVSTASARK
jgi:hypothetical protein